MIELQVIKALQFTVALTVSAITAAYTRESWSALWADPDNLAARYAVAIWGFCGLAQSLFYVPLTVSYLFEGAQPRSTPGLDTGFRILGLSLMLLLGAYILAVAPGSLARTMHRFWMWLVLMAAVCVGVFIWLPYAPLA